MVSPLRGRWAVRSLALGRAAVAGRGDNAPPARRDRHRRRAGDVLHGGMGGGTASGAGAGDPLSGPRNRLAQSLASPRVRVHAGNVCRRPERLPASHRRRRRAPPTSFRAPEWSISDRVPWALEVLAREGFSVDASMAPVKLVGRLDYPRRPHVRTTPSGDIVEVPPFVADRFGQVMPMGWGWGLRMSSPRRVLSSIAQANRRGEPAVLTVHPWEVDPDPPRVWLPPRLMFAHYFRLGGFERRLKDIMHGATFSTLRATATCAAPS